MIDFLAWALLITVIGSWLIVPWKPEPLLRLFRAESEEEVLRRFAENRRWMAAVGLVFLMDFVAVALSLVVLI